MSAETTRAADVDSLKSLLLDMADQQTCDAVLQMVVDRLNELSDVALARIWLLRPGDVCSRCRMRPECPDQTVCLHLVASAGRSAAEPDADWSRLDGDFRRFPVGVRKVGHIAASRQPVEVADVSDELEWLARPDWARAEGIRSLSGQPLLSRGDLLGVLVIFSRALGDRDLLVWLRMIADHAAAAIANARAFEEIHRLREQLALENDYLRQEVREAQAFGDIVGTSPVLRAILEQIELVAPTGANVLILGESGTGKELVAREIHNRSDRADGPMIKVNCASIPRDLYESEFFGHVKGAFTGAVRDRAGRFDAADGGTLFLDEVGEIPLELQSKLLRVLQEGQFERVGDERTRTADVRVVAATNRELRREVDEGRFREDLYYRLNVFPIDVAPLRRRKEDVPALASHFLAIAAGKLGRPLPRLTQANVMALQAYDWPGNVRELQNAIERAVIVARDGKLHFDLGPSGSAGGGLESAAGPPGGPRPSGAAVEVVPDSEIRRYERDNIVAALEKAEWRIYGTDGAAELLGVKPTTLSSRIKKLGIERPGGTGE